MSQMILILEKKRRFKRSRAEWKIRKQRALSLVEQTWAFQDVLSRQWEIESAYSSMSSSRSIASGFASAAGAAGPAGEGRLPPSGPVLAATKPTGARAWRSMAAMASARPVSSSPACSSSGRCWLRAIACDAMKLTSVL